MTDVPQSGSIFRWETLRELGVWVLDYEGPIRGKSYEVELTSGTKVEVWRGDDGQTYFCHGLTFGGTEAPGGPVSPFSDKHVMTIVQHHYRLVTPESAAVAGDIVVWLIPGGITPHSAILVEPVVAQGKQYLDYNSKLRTKNGIQPETVMTLGKLIESYYGETYNVFRRK
jgi:hypothetical protein